MFPKYTTETGECPLKSLKLTFLVDEMPFVARLIADKFNLMCNPNNGAKLLSLVVQEWVSNGFPHVKYLVTPGGFINVSWPAIGDPREIIKYVIESVKNVFLVDELLSELQKVTDYLTLGVDSAYQHGNPRKPHLELVVIIKTSDKSVCWTGKSYPTSDQVNGLIRIEDLKSHFLTLNSDSVMILGCHDLNMFNPRAYANAGPWRRQIIDEFIKLALEHKPSTVLQHPHTTDTPNTWRNAWKQIEKLFPNIKYIAAFRYYNPDGEIREELSRVRKETKKGNTIDIIIHK